MGVLMAELKGRAAGDKVALFLREALGMEGLRSGAQAQRERS
jgi:hypothetical protein